MCVINGDILLPILPKENVWPGVFDSLDPKVIRLALYLQDMLIECSQMSKNGWKVVPKEIVELFCSPSRMKNNPRLAVWISLNRQTSGYPCG
jgi:hypothetical protein